MTLREAIDRVDALKPNAFERHQKVLWLSQLDGRVQTEIMDAHEDSPGEFHGYTDDTDGLTDLLVPPPYDDVYVKWLSAQIDLANREILSFNNEIAVFNATLADFSHYWTRTHMPKSARFRFFARREKRHEGPLS